MKKVVILGKPNVGKSSLFNRIARERIAITSDFAGTTRDVNIKQVALGDEMISLLDTGGIDDSDGIFTKIRELAIDSAKKSDLVLYVVDGKSIPNDEDIKLFRELSKKVKNIFLVINKIDNDKERDFAYDFVSFGSKDIFFISVSHNRGIASLLDSVISALGIENISEIEEEESIEDYIDSLENQSLDGDRDEGLDFKCENIDENLQERSLINVGIIGRVNVGKSSLLNALSSIERSVVSDVPGTTIDPVDEAIEYKDKIINFVDTAGIRRRSKIEGIEKFALDRTTKVLQKSDIVLMVLDCSTPFVELDEKISGLVDKYGLGVILILNKWDIRFGEFKEIEKELRRKFRFLEYAPMITVSALKKRHIKEIKDMILNIHQNFTRRIGTSLLNRTIEEAVARHPLPSDHGKLVRIYYATQYDTSPPTIMLSMNRPDSLHFSYKRYLVNFLRDRFEFGGVPIIIKANKRGQKIEDDSEPMGSEDTKAESAIGKKF